jgi:hypothetical protein
VAKHVEIKDLDGMRRRVGVFDFEHRAAIRARGR